MISVLMTTYNCAAFIDQAIKSVLNQTFKDFEFLIIDDGSTDNSEEIVKSFSDIRINYKRIEHHGRSYALNYGLKNAKYDWVALMDSDDICHPNRLEKQLYKINDKENIILNTWSVYFKKNKIQYLVQTPSQDTILKQKLSLHSYICNSSIIFNKNFILKQGGYDENLEYFEDYDLWLRFNQKCEFVTIPEYLMFVRIRPDSSSRKHFEKKVNKLYLMQENYYKEFEKNFSVKNINDQNAIKGWREYFYGDKSEARIYWKSLPKRNWDYRIFVAYLTTYLNKNSFELIKNYRIRLRLNYLCFINNRREATKRFNEALYALNQF